MSPVVRRDHGVAQDAPNARGVEAVDLPQATDAAQVLEVGIGVEAVLAAASRPDEALALPEAQRGRRDADTPCGLADQVAHGTATTRLASAACRWLQSWTSDERDRNEEDQRTKDVDLWRDADPARSVDPQREGHGASGAEERDDVVVDRQREREQAGGEDARKDQGERRPARTSSRSLA